MKLIIIISYALLMLVGPFSLGILYAASRVDERVKLELPYKVTKYISLVALFFVLMGIVYSGFHEVK